MTTFKKYMHLERFGNDEVQGIELGECYIFPKIDGTNASVWVGDDLSIKYGSRNRELSLDSDNAGFMAATAENREIQHFLSTHPSYRLYGEWLVPHSLKTYREDAWRVFYVFDVFDSSEDKYLPYDEYSVLLDTFGVQCIPPTSIIKNPSYEQLVRELDKNTYLISDGKGAGEGIVIKNYEFENRFKSTVWAKIVTTEFKEKHVKAMGPSVIAGAKMIEQEIVDKFVTMALVDKVHAKIGMEMNGWKSQYIPRLLNTVYYDLVNEEIWNIVKKMKNPTINFKTLFSLTTLEIKKIKPELF